MTVHTSATSTLTRFLAVTTLTGLATAIVAAAGAVPTGKPEEAGFSTERLGRIREAVQRHISAGQVPGAVTLVSRRGKVVHFGAGGFERQPDQGGLSSPIYFSCSGGMVSTAEDYLQFAQMLVNGGELNGRRYLGPKTVALLASNHTGELVNGQFGRPARGMGFGLGVQVVEDPVAADLRQSKGTFGWAGAYGTNINIDRQEKMVTIIMQTSTPQLQRDFENAVMQAIID